jgi:ketosteroid isomerase-like protein
MTLTTPDSPAAVSHAFTTAINAGDIGGALGLYRADAVLLSPDGSQARGAGAIRQLLENLVSMNVTLTTHMRSVVIAGDYAVASEDWTMRLDTAPGESAQEGRSIVCFARDGGGWRFVVDAPWGL